MLRQVIASSTRTLARNLPHRPVRPCCGFSSLAGTVQTARRSGPVPQAATLLTADGHFASPRTLASSQRWFFNTATQPVAPVPEAEAQPASNAPAPAADGNAPADAEIVEALKADLAKWKDLATRRLADYYNMQQQHERQAKATRDFAIQEFAKDLIESMDNFERVIVTATAAVAEAKAVASAETPAAATTPSADAADAASWLDGLRLTEASMLRVLEKHGLVRMDPLNQKFNPNEQEAVMMAPQPEKEDKTVFFVQQKGYRLKSRIIRAAKVGVVDNRHIGGQSVNSL